MEITCTFVIIPIESYHVCTAVGNCRVTDIRRTMQNEMVVNIFRRMIPLMTVQGYTDKKTTRNPEKKKAELVKNLIEAAFRVSFSSTLWKREDVRCYFLFKCQVSQNIKSEHTVCSLGKLQNLSWTQLAYVIMNEYTIFFTEYLLTLL